MKGVVFNILAEITQQEFGEDVWDELLEKAGLSGSYTAVGSYDDAELFKLVEVAAETMHQSATTVVEWFGQKALPLFAERYPQFFAGHTSTRSFLLSLNDIIHPEVVKLYPGAETPEFGFDAATPNVLRMEYRSRRRLCAFAVGLIEGAAAFYGEGVVNEHACGLHLGTESCLFNLTFRPLES
jgi:Haem-NO-binding